MIIKLHMPDDWSTEQNECWLEWLKSRIEEKEDLLLRHVEKAEVAEKYCYYR